MGAVAIFSIDPVLRRNLEQLPRDDPTVVLVGVVDRPRSLWELVDENHVDAVLTDAPTRELLADYRGRHDRTALVVLLDGADAEDTVRVIRVRAPCSIARPVAMRSSQPLRRLPPALASCRPTSLPRCFTKQANGVGHARLTRRELEVLAAMADGASNKAIARRLGISFHTAKFHVAAILAKLDADSRTEAVAKAAQLGLVML
jgi:DNA-binding NarL/FixJ family response regulator